MTYPDSAGFQLSEIFHLNYSNNRYSCMTLAILHICHPKHPSPPQKKKSRIFCFLFRFNQVMKSSTYVSSGKILQDVSVQIQCTRDRARISRSFTEGQARKYAVWIW